MVALVGALLHKSRNIECGIRMIYSADNSSDSALFVRHLKEEIDRLTQEQDEATRSGEFPRMTLQEEQEFFARRRRIADLIQELAFFERTRDGATTA
jgi:hypothetical protein